MAEKRGNNQGAVEYTRSSSENGGFSFGLHAACSTKKKTTWDNFFFLNPMHQQDSPRDVYHGSGSLKFFFKTHATG